ncbi:MAG: SurA N-terminal domain-containing protein [Candidatus Dormibacter sp.]
MRRTLVIVLVLLCSGCSSAAPSPSGGSQVIARVGPTAITNELFQVRLTSALTSVAIAGGPTNNPAMRSQVRASVLRSLIIDTVIAQEAAASGVAATDAEVQAQVQADVTAAGGTNQLQSRLASLGGSMAQLHDEITSSINEQKLEDVFAKQRALEIEQKLAAGVSFATLAAQYSDDTTTAPKGGELGAVSRTQVQGDDPVYAGPVLALVAGRYTTTPIRDAQGYDIVQLESSTATTLRLRHIVVNAPEPYTVKERPNWFGEAIFESIAQDCSANQIHVYVGDVGDDLCAAVSASAAPSPVVTPVHTP